MWGQIAAIAAPIVGGIIGNAVSGGDRRNADEMAQQAAQELLNLGLPPDISKAIILEQFKSAGIYTPEMEKNLDSSVSQFSKLREDQDLLSMQKQALRDISQTASTGQTAASQAALNKASRDQSRDLNAKMQQIQMQAQMQGQANSGANQVAQMLAAQSSANSLADQQQQAVAQASDLARQARTEALRGMGDVRSQDYKVKSDRASAEDQMDRFNVQNRMGVQQRNVSSKNQGALVNLQNQQDLINKNVGMNNQELLRQNEAKRTNWLDTAERAKLRSGAFNSEAGRFSGRAANTQNQWQGIGNAVSSGINKFGQQSKPMNNADDVESENDLTAYLQNYDANRKKSRGY